MTVIISTSYFSIKDQIGVKILKKYWWKNSIIQIMKYNNETFIIATIGHGKANAAMTATYLIEKYTTITSVINIDLALSTNQKLKTSDVTISTKFIYRDVDQTIFDDIKYGQVVNETETFQFEGHIANKIQNLKLGLLESVIGTGDMLIYNTKQFKELIEKYGNSIDVIDEEAGALAQVLKKTNVNFVSLKVIYNNALSPWDNDPKHRYKMYEVTNTFKYLIKRLLNFLSSKFEYLLMKANDDTLNAITSIMEVNKDEWILKFKSDTNKVIAINNNSFVLLDKYEKDPMSVELFKVKGFDPKVEFEDSEPIKIILGLDEWKYAPTKWRGKLPIIDQVQVNDEELLWNKSSKYNKSVDKDYKIETIAKEFANIVKQHQINKDNISYDNKKIQNKSLLLYWNSRISFYISQNVTHELIDDNKFGPLLIKNEFVKYLNNEFSKMEMKYDKIHIYINFPALFNKKIQLFFSSEVSIGKIINFGKVNSTMQNEYTVVDNAKYEKDINKVGSFKTSIKLKSE